MASAESDVVLALINHALDEQPPSGVERRLRSLRSIALEAPTFALEELDGLAEAQAALLPTHQPTTVLHRAVSLETFHLYCTSDEWRPPVVGSEEFRRQVERAPDPSSFLLSTLDLGVVFPARHSWLIESAAIEALDGSRLVRALQLDKQAPPFVLCRLTPARMSAAGVRVRRPSGYDAVLGRHTIWSTAGVPGGTEFVDLDIAGSAIEATLWRP